MTVNALIQNMSLEPLHLSDGEREVSGGYTGDLLSWVLGRAEEHMLWITIMTNVNILAVAALRNLPAILIAENADVPPEVIRRAAEQQINLLRSPLSAYALCATLARLLG